jgi:tetratricopeptide (TPR) repeat protein
MRNPAMRPRQKILLILLLCTGVLAAWVALEFQGILVFFADSSDSSVATPDTPASKTTVPASLSASSQMLIGHLAHHRLDMLKASEALGEVIRMSKKDGRIETILLQRWFESLLYVKGLIPALDIVRDYTVDSPQVVSYLPLMVEAFHKHHYARALNLGSELAKTTDTQNHVVGFLITVMSHVGMNDLVGARLRLDRDADSIFSPELTSFLRAMIACWAQDPADKALALLDEAAAVYPRSYSAYQWIARAYRQYGQTAVADSMIAHYHELHPFGGYALGSMVVADQKDWTPASLRDKFPQSLTAAVMNDIVSDFLYHWSEPDTPSQDDPISLVAVYYLALAKALDDSQPFGWYLEGRWWSRLEQLSAALDPLEHLAESQSAYSPMAFALLTDILFQHHQTDQALATVERGIAHYPGVASLSLMAHDIDLRLGNFASAMARIDRILDHAPRPLTKNYWSVLLLKARAYEQLQDLPKALSTAREALDLQPDQPDIANYLGYHLLLLDPKSEEAESLIRLAYEKRPNSVPIMDSYAWLLYHRGNFEQARGILEQALSFHYHDPMLYFHLGEVYHALGASIQACFAWRKAENYPEFASSPEAALVKQHLTSCEETSL